MLIVILILAVIGLFAAGRLVFDALGVLLGRVPHGRQKVVVRMVTRAALGVCILLAGVQVWNWTLGRPSEDEREVRRIYRNFSYAMYAKDYDLAFAYMTPQFRRTHSPSDLAEVFSFFTPMMGEPAYLPDPNHYLHLSGDGAQVHPFEVGWFEFVNGPVLNLRKISSSDGAEDCGACWYITGKYEWYLD